MKAGGVIVGKPFIIFPKYFEKICIGLNGIMTLRIYGRGISITICRLGTIYKWIEFEIGWNPIWFKKYNF